MFTITATGLDGDELFRPASISNTPGRRDSCAPTKRSYFQNAASTDSGKVISEEKHIDVHHCLALPELLQSSKNWLVPISRHGLHQIKTSLVLLPVVHRLLCSLHDHAI